MRGVSSAWRAPPRWWRVLAAPAWTAAAALRCAPPTPTPMQRCLATKPRGAPQPEGEEGDAPRKRGRRKQQQQQQQDKGEEENESKPQPPAPPPSHADATARRLEAARRVLERASATATAGAAAAAATPPSSGSGDEAAARRAAAAEDAAYAKALARAMRLVNFRERSARELEGRLRDDGYSEAVAARAVARLQELVRATRSKECAWLLRHDACPRSPSCTCSSAASAPLAPLNQTLSPVILLLSLLLPSKKQTQGLQDDARYAQMFARWRWRTGARAPAHIARELKLKGVDPADAAAALEAVFGPGGRMQRREVYGDGDEQEEGGDGGSAGGAGISSSKEESPWEQLVRQAARRAELSQGERPDKRRAKLARWLAYRGHGWDTVRQVLKEVGL